jgi:hypothetical protein
MKNLSCNIVIMAVCLLFVLAREIQSQNSVIPSKIGEVNIGQAPQNIATLVITRDNHYLAQSKNNSLDFNQKLSYFDSQLNKLWEKKMSTPYLSTAPYNCVVASNTDNGVLAVGDDTLFVYDSNGNLTSVLKTPGEGANNQGNKMIFKDDDHYYVVTFENQFGPQLVTVYDNGLSLIRSFPIETYHGVVYGFVSENNGQFLYIASCQPGGGDSCNYSSNLSKYTLLGDLIWTRHLPDRINPKLCLGIDGIYCFSNLVFHTRTTTAWEIIKFDTAGTQVWEKLWLGGYPGDSTALNMSNGDIIPYGSGVIAVGASTRLDQNPNSPSFNINNVEAVAIGFDSLGGIMWQTKLTDTVDGAGFGEARWDNNHFLIIEGTISRMNKIWKYNIPGITGIASEKSVIPKNFSLSQNYPNPFNPTTTISFFLTVRGMVSLKIYDLLGKEVSVLLNQEMTAGAHQVQFNASSFSSGVYIYTLSSKFFMSSKKMVLLK